jgi:DNA-binding protein H-NS
MWQMLFSVRPGHYVRVNSNLIARAPIAAWRYQILKNSVEKKMDLSNMSLAELRELNEKISHLLDQGVQRRRERAIQEIIEVASSVGLSIREILKGNANPKAAQRSKTQSYIDPSNPSNVWGGAGPRPAWLKSAIAAGVPNDQLRAEVKR